MAEEPDRLKQDIENTRASLTRDVDLLAEKTSPKKVAQRRWTSVKEKVMGSTDAARHAASDTAGTVQDKASSASTVQDKASQLGDTARTRRTTPPTRCAARRRRSPSRPRATRSPPASSRSASACWPPP